MTARDDLRALSIIDKSHHLRVQDASDGWFDRSKFITLSEQAGDGTPLVAVNLRYPEPCPIDRTADMHIVHWLTNLRYVEAWDTDRGNDQQERERELQQAFVRNIEAINTEMVKVGATHVWGIVPKSATYLTSLLDPVAAAGKCQRIDGTDVDVGPYEGQPMDGVVFYIGLGQDVTDYIQ